MKLATIVILEDLADFEQPEQTEAGKLQAMQSKVKSLSHHRQILMTLELEFEQIHEQGKMTPALKQKWDVVKRKVQAIKNQFDQFKVQIGKHRLTNPLSQCDKRLYAGPPEQYPDLTKTQVPLYHALQKTLAKVGIPPLTTLYGGRRHDLITFIVVNANHTFAWRKHGSQYGASNEVYFPGKPSGMIRTTEFIAHPEDFLQAFKDLKYEEDQKKGKKEFW